VGAKGSEDRLHLCAGAHSLAPAQKQQPQLKHQQFFVNQPPARRMHLGHRARKMHAAHRLLFAAQAVFFHHPGGQRVFDMRNRLKRRTHAFLN